jgi:hypothetical protein
MSHSNNQNRPLASEVTEMQEAERGSGATGATPLRREVSDISVVQKGTRLQISATVDLEGIDRLKKMLDAYAEALKLMQ